MKLLLLSLMVLSVAACDAQDSCDNSAPETPPAVSDVSLAPGLPLAGPYALPGEEDDVSFRQQGDPELWAVTSWGGQKIGVGQFVSIVVGCLDQNPPVWTCSLSAYQPDTSKPERVGGLGCSAWWSQSYYQCQLDAFKANGAVKLQ